MSVISKFCQTQQFRRTLAEYRENLYRIAYSWCHNPALADDLVQETLAKALKNSSQLRDQQTIRAWLYRILSNCWRDHFRCRRETVDVDDIVLIETQTPDLQHDRQQIVNPLDDPQCEQTLAEPTGTFHEQRMGQAMPPPGPFEAGPLLLMPW